MNKRTQRAMMLFLVSLVTVSTVLAQGGFTLSWFTVDGGGGQTQGGTYTINATIGQADAGGSLSGGQYTLAGGFWGGGRFPAAPTVTAITPNSGLNSQETPVTISGSNFDTSPRVTLGETELTQVQVDTPNLLRAVVPAAMPPGTYDLTVINPGGQSGQRANAFTVQAAPAPTVTSVTPNTGRNDQAVGIDLRGTNFVAGSEVTLGSRSLAGEQVRSATHIVVTVPAGIPAGSYNVTVTNPGGGSGTLAGGYTVVGPPPTILSVRPVQGRNNSTTTLVIDGSNFVAVPRVTLGSTQLFNIRYNAPTQIEATVPGLLTPGTYGVTVTNPDGQRASVGSVFTITTLPPPPSYDLAFGDWEVTQGIQNLANDVPLVAEKSTYVRVYARNLNGPAANLVPMILEARRNGVLLPDSPLSPINGARNLVVGLGYDRSNANDSWTFRLPQSWTTQGNVTLRALIDPYQRFTDPNRTNNERSGTFNFDRRAPICAVFIPVRTHSPAASTSLPNFWFSVDMANRLLPTESLWVYQQSSDIAELQARFGIPPWEYGPYELDDDKWKIMLSLWTRDQFSDDPDECDDRDARTHYIGIVHPDASGGPNGSGRRDGDQLFYKLPPTVNMPDFRTNRAPTLAHELGHNYDRGHVDCPSGDPDDPDTGYPYPSCQLAPVDPRGYYGFDFATMTPIDPDDAGDLMSYAHRRSPELPRWTSDYTWRAIRNGIENNLMLSKTSDIGRDVMAEATAAVYISGGVDLTGRVGTLDYAYTYPISSLSAGQRTKLERLIGETAQAVSQANPAQDLTVRLLDEQGRVLATHPVVPFKVEDQETPIMREPFALAFPAPTGTVARMELVSGQTVLATIAPGGAKPVVTIVSPTPKQQVSNRLTVSWRMSDADVNDRLLSSVQYSSDNGTTWVSLVANYAMTRTTSLQTLDLTSLAGLKGGQQALVRVAVSDGYNTTLAVSQPFVVTQQQPVPYIVSPAAGQVVAPGQAALLRGGAADAEDGPLSGTRLRWTMDGRDVGTGAEVDVGGLAPGRHTVILKALDSAGGVKRIGTTFDVKQLEVPQAVAPSGNRMCDDPAYTRSASLPLAPYGDGGQAQSFLLRSQDALYVCLAGLTPNGAVVDRAGVYLDLDPGAAASQTPNVYRVFVDRRGLVTIEARNREGVFQSATVTGIRGRVTGDARRWNVELRIPAATLRGWGRTIGLVLAHVRPGTPGQNFLWPYIADLAKPSTWASTVLGQQPHIARLAPAQTTVGGSAFTLTVEGSGFATGSTVLWDGVARTTTVVSSTRVTVAITAADIAQARTVTITVSRPDVAGAVSAPVTFVVNNPVPAVGQATFSGQGTTRTLLIRGTSFVEGSAIYFDGEALTTSFVNTTTVRATVNLAGRGPGQVVGVSIHTPPPGGGVSNVVQVNIPFDLGPSRGSKVFLPLVLR